MTCTYSIDIGDYLTLAESIPSKSYDHVFKDTPYSPKTHNNYRQGGGTEKRRGVRTVSSGRPLAYGAITPAHRRQWAFESARIARRWVLGFTDDHGIEGWRRDFEDAGLIYVRLLVWVRGTLDIDPVIGGPAVRGKKGAPQFTGDRHGQICEFIVLCHTPDVPCRWNGRGARTDGTGGKTGGGSVYFADIASDERVIGTDGQPMDGQKPLALISELMRDLTDPGDSILDPFVGSGTTVRAAINEGRSARGIELNPARAAAARAVLPVTLGDVYLALAIVLIASIVVPGLGVLAIRRHRRHQFMRPAKSVDFTRLPRQSSPRARLRRRAWPTI